MGKLLDQVLAIHESRSNLDTTDYKINNYIQSINSKILEAANKGKTTVYINFEVINDSITTTVSVIDSTYTTYTCYLNELKSVNPIKQRLMDYYKNEGFSVEDSSYSLRIIWYDKVL